MSDYPTYVSPIEYRSVPLVLSERMFQFAIALMACASVAFLADGTGTWGVRVITFSLLFACLTTNLRFLLIAIFAAMPFSQSLLGPYGAANISAVDILSFVALLILLNAASRSELNGGPALTGLVLFLIVSMLSSIEILSNRSTMVSLGRNFTVSLIPLLLFGSTEGENLRVKIKIFEQALFAYVLASMLLSVFVIYTFVTAGAGAAMYTLTINKNALGPTLGVAVAICFATLLTSAKTMRTWQLQVLCAFAICGVGLLLSFSRGAWLSSGVSCVLILWLSGRYTIAFPTALVGSVVVLIVWAYVPEKIADYATDIGSRSGTIRARILSIEDTLELWAQKPLFGHGVGLRKVVAPHNLIIEMLGEVGVVGLAFFVLAVIGAFFTMKHAWRESYFYPRLQFLLLASTSTFVLTILHGMMDSYWRRGVACAGWAAIGMMVALTSSIWERSSRAKGSY